MLHENDNIFKSMKDITFEDTVSHQCGVTMNDSVEARAIAELARKQVPEEVAAAYLRDHGFIGCEPFLNGVAKLLAEIEMRKLTNLRIHYGDARPLLEALPPESFERIDLLGEVHRA